MYITVLHITRVKSEDLVLKEDTLYGQPLYSVDTIALCRHS